MFVCWLALVKVCFLNTRVATTPGNSWKLLETPGIGIYSWKTLLEMRKLRKTPGKLLKIFLILK